MNKNSNNKIKNIVLIIIMLLAVVSIITGIVLLGNNDISSSSDKAVDDVKPEVSIDVSRDVELIDDNEWNIITEVTPDSNGYIKSTGEGNFILLMVEDNEIKDYSYLNEDYKVKNDNYEYYKISMLENIIKCESSINYEEKDYKYEVSLKIRVVDPIVFFAAVDMLNFDTSENMFGGYTTKNLFNDVLKKIFEENINSIILEYFENNDEEFESSFELSDYVANEIEQIIGPITGLSLEPNYLNIN